MSDFAKTKYTEKSALLKRTEKAIQKLGNELRKAEAAQNEALQAEIAPIQEQVKQIQARHQQMFQKKNAQKIGQMQQLESRRERLTKQLKSFADAALTGAELNEDDPSLKDLPSDKQLDATIEQLAAEADKGEPAPTADDTAK